jgi:hypothetical protein
MTTRLLSRAEYGRLDGLDLGAIAQDLPPTAKVIVVEDGDDIVAAWSLFPVWHAEGLCIRPSHQRRPGVALRLFRGMKRLASGLGIHRIATAAASPDIVAYLGRVGAEELPGRHYVWSVEG